MENNSNQKNTHDVAFSAALIVCCQMESTRFRTLPARLRIYLAMANVANTINTVNALSIVGERFDGTFKKLLGVIGGEEVELEDVEKAPMVAM